MILKKKIIEDLKKKQKELVGAHKKELSLVSLTINKKESRQTHRKFYKKKIRAVLEIYNGQLKHLNKTLDSVNIKDLETEANSDFKLNFIERNEQAPTSSDCLFSKDVANIPDRKYHIFRKSLKLKIGSLYRVKRLRATCSTRFKPVISKLSTGYYIDPVLKIKEQISRLLDSEVIKSGEKIWVKISADGTNISRNVTLINMVLNIINERARAASASGCYRVGMFKIEDENYESVKKWLPVIWDKIKELDRIFYDKAAKRVLRDDESVYPINQNTEVFEIEYFFSADWKMMAIILGINNANSTFPCLFCETDDLSKKGGFFNYFDIDVL